MAKKRRNNKGEKGDIEVSSNVVLQENRATTLPEVKVIKLVEIKPADYNPREIKDEAFDGLRNSLRRFGYVDLLVVNKRNMTIVGGHQRFKVLADEGVEEAPVVLVDFDDKTERALNITLNNQAIMGSWTKAIIPMLEEIRQSFPDEYLDLRLEELRAELSDLEEENIGKTLPDEVPRVPKTAITQKGDLWILGDHRLMCGDSLNEADVEKLMDGNKAQLFASDPPYIVGYTGKDRPKKKDGRSGGKDWTDVYREIDIEDPLAFWTGYLAAGKKFVDKNAAIYIWHAFTRFPLLYECLERTGLLCHQQIIWVKPKKGISFSFYPWVHEPCVMAWQKGNRPRYNKVAREAGTVWELDLMRADDPETPEYYTDVWHLDWEGKKNISKSIHPTQKPTEVFAIPMRVHTRPGEICYEPFSGSGSQIIAAERLNRRCFAMEVEPVFCDVAITRWEEFTGRKAQRIKAYG